MQWLRQPGELADREVCLLVSWSAEPHLAEHAAYLARAWCDAGFAVILVVMRDDVVAFDVSQDLSFCEGVLLRGNEGYDFGAWAAAIRTLPQIAQARLLALANDSVFGPFDGFAGLLDLVRSSPADVIGAVGSNEHGAHLQSFLVFFKPRALRHGSFGRFWRAVRNGDRAWAIRRYELRLEAFYRRAGLSTAALFPPPRDAGRLANRTLTQWRDLLDAGFPFLKTQLVRDNPFGADLAGWREAVAARGYDPAIIDRYLAANPPRR